MARLDPFGLSAGIAAAGAFEGEERITLGHDTGPHDERPQWPLEAWIERERRPMSTKRLRLTDATLRAIVRMSARVEAADADDFSGMDLRHADPKVVASWEAAWREAVSAGDWARQELDRRAKKRSADR
jgi:hypothetical protein